MSDHLFLFSRQQAYYIDDASDQIKSVSDDSESQWATAIAIIKATDTQASRLIDKLEKHINQLFLRYLDVSLTFFFLVGSAWPFLRLDVISLLLMLENIAMS